MSNFKFGLLEKKNKALKINEKCIFKKWQGFSAHKPATTPTNRDRCQENKKTQKFVNLNVNNFSLSI